jgi:hypothetical protein
MTQRPTQVLRTTGAARIDSRRRVPTSGAGLLRLSVLASDMDLRSSAMRTAICASTAASIQSSTNPRNALRKLATRFSRSNWNASSEIIEQDCKYEIMRRRRSSAVHGARTSIRTSASLELMCRQLGRQQKPQHEGVCAFYSARQRGAST